MSISTVSVGMFINAMSKWVAAVEQSDYVGAGFYANEVRVAGKVLAVDPAFKQLFKAHSAECGEHDPEAVFECLGAFVTAIAAAERSRGNGAVHSNGHPHPGARMA